MIGIDTSVLVRYLAQDDGKLSPVATKLIDALTPLSPGFVTTVALIELVWVMQRRYGSTKQEVIAMLERLVNNQAIFIERPLLVQEAVLIYSASNADFADCLLERCARAAGCVHTVTFDRRAAKIDGMQLLR